jgi:hypothetical protein
MDASDYKLLTGIAQESYERRLLAEARALMMGEWTVREIIGDDEGPGLSGVREPRRPRPPHRSDAAEEATPPTD